VSIAEPEVEIAPPPIPAPVAPPATISFQNGPAVRIALSMGLLAFVCMLIAGQLALPEVLIFVGLTAAGFLAVYLYRRSTGQRLSVMNGARLGWISGIFGFVILALLLTLITVALSDPKVVMALREQAGTRGLSEANLDQIIKALHTPAGVTEQIGLFFLLFTVLPAAGGAVGALFLNRD
jgi:hypothetical protein